MAKVILITGGSSGIGKSIGEFLLGKGYCVYGTSRDPSKYPNSKFSLLPLDVTDRNSIKKCISDVLNLQGRLDVLVNNAGAGITGPIEEIPDKEIQRNFDTNFFGPVSMIQTALPAMRAQNSGLIINITSIAGYMGLPYRGVYCASKGALEIITEAFRMEIKDFNIKMTNIAPGDFATNIASGRYHAPLLDNSAYKTPYGNTLKLMDTHVDDGSDPRIMANAVYKIIETDNPKIHYKVGKFLQKFSIVLKRILPDRAYEYMLEKHYKI